MFYVNGGKYDNTFIHRSTIANPNDPNNNFGIIQGGGFYVANDPQLGQRGHQFGAQPQEGAFSNVRGTLALANQGFSNTTENQWYFNVTDNSAGFDPRFTVLGQVASANFCRCWTIWIRSRAISIFRRPVIRSTTPTARASAPTRSSSN